MVTSTNQPGCRPLLLEQLQAARWDLWSLEEGVNVVW